MSVLFWRKLEGREISKKYIALYFLNVNWGWKHLPATVATIIPFLGSDILNWNAGRGNLRVVYSLSCHLGGDAGSPQESDMTMEFPEYPPINRGH